MGIYLASLEASRTKAEECGIALGKPFVFINSAMSADGKISTILHKQVRISGKKDLARVDGLRASCDAIMVGVGTVLADDPSLRIKSKQLRDARLDKGVTENPLRIVADSRARTPLDARVLGDGCIVAVSKASPPERLARLSEKCQIEVAGEIRVDLVELMEALYKIGVKRLMVEGGGTLNWGMINAGLVDEIYVYVGNMLIGGDQAPTLVDGLGFSASCLSLELFCLEKMDSGVLLKWRIKK